MSNDKRELACEIMEMYIEDDLQLIIPNPVEIWDEQEEEPDQAFVVDIDGDLQGVNGYDLEKCQDEIAEIQKDIAKEISEIYKNLLNEDYNLTGIDNEEIDSSDVVVWMSEEYYDHVKNVYSSENRVPAVNYLATHPLNSSDILVAENCVINKQDSRV